MLYFIKGLEEYLLNDDKPLRSSNEHSFDLHTATIQARKHAEDSLAFSYIKTYEPKSRYDAWGLDIPGLVHLQEAKRLAMSRPDNWR